MKRVALLFASLVLVFPSPAHAVEADAAKPNVLLIAIDDLNDWVGCLGGHPDTHTPNMDRLAKRGVLFTNAHCQAPVCNPSRTSFMTGLRPSTTGIYFNSPWFRNTPANKDRVTMSQHFAGHGYSTSTTGKIYHASRVDRPSFETLGPLPSQRNPKDRRIHRNLPGGSHGLWDFGPQSYDEREFNDFADATWVIEQMRAKHDRPFFMAVGFYRPHVPFYAPERVFKLIPRDKISLPTVKDDDRDDLPEIAKRITTNRVAPPHSWFVENDEWRYAVQSYLACVRFVDEQVGRLLDALDASPHSKNTIVVLLSDHGFHLGEKQRWAKTSLWERSTRVPLIISVPDEKKGVRCSRPVELLSIYPTLIELCGLKDRKELEGASLSPLLKDAKAEWERPAITTFGKDNHAVRSDRWRYIRYSDGSEELYDHDKDPHEWRNLAGESEHADVIERHRKWLPKVNAEPAPGSLKKRPRRGRRPLDARPAGPRRGR